VVEHAVSWTGRYFDPVTGLQWNRARWYNPEIGRWMSRDHIPDDPQHMGRYVGNAPSMNTDPSGLEADHHIVSKELWDQFGFGAEAKDVFNGAVVGVGGNHDYSRHGWKTGYTGHVTVELNQQLCEFVNRHNITGALSPEQQKQFAEEFVDHIRHKTTNKYILGFNEHVKGGKEDLIKWWNEDGKKLSQPELPKNLRRASGELVEDWITKFKKFGRKAKGPLPGILGVPFSLWCFGDNAEAKGVNGAIADEVLDSMPGVEWAKAGTEIISGYEWIPKEGEKGMFYFFFWVTEGQSKPPGVGPYGFGW
jgi:RHS repeat-associated protein